jgi:hypothetical protein
MGDKESLVDAHGNVLATLKNVKDKVVFDEAALREAHPEIYQKFVTTQKGHRRLHLKK